MTSLEESSQKPLVRLSAIAKAFNGLPVLNGVTLELLPGEIHFLAGENGAGKSTLMRILAGIHQPDAGTIEVDGRPVQIVGPREALALGIGMIHQELSLAPNLTVAENLCLGREPRRPFGRLDRRRALQDSEAILQSVGADFAPHTPVGRLSVGQQQLVEIGRVLAQRPRILILDEPTAALSQTEESRLLSIVSDLRRQGLAVVFITHRMDEITQLADKVTVLRDGTFVETLPRTEATPERIVTRMVGRPLSNLFPERARDVARAPRLEVQELTDAKRVHVVNLSVRAGEIVGVAGLIGSGRTEMARLIYGADAVASGHVIIDGKRRNPDSPRSGMKHGIAMLHENRKDQGLFLQLSVAENICLTVLTKVSRAGQLSPRQLDLLARPLVEKMRIKTPSLHTRVSELSGGNQQKVLLARCLAQNPDVLILDEPTRGVDVGAKADIYELVNEVAARGVAVLVISSELPEVLGLSDRVYVMREGRLVAELSGEQLTEESVMKYATGLAKTHSESVITGEIPTDAMGGTR